MMLKLRDFGDFVDRRGSLAVSKNIQNMGLFRRQPALREFLLPQPEYHESGVVQESPQAKIAVIGWIFFGLLA